MIDFHSHVIYGVDDGSIDEEMTLNMLKIAKESGTELIVATPHFFKGRFEVELSEITKIIDKIRGLAFDNNISIKLCLGQEVRYDENILDYYLKSFISTINNSRYMLIELPMKEFSIYQVINDIYELQLKGIIPILAHPERYDVFQEEPELINKFIDEGYLFQLNVGSLDGDYGKGAQKLSHMLLENRVYSVIGSDAHNISYRNTDMRRGIKVIEKKCPGYLHIIMEDSKSILANKIVNFNGNKIKKQSIFRIIKDKFH